MRSIFFAVPLFLCVGIGTAQETVIADKKTIAWDEVKYFVNGSSIPSGDTVEYEVWIRPSSGLKTLLGATKAPTFDVALPGPGVYAVGVRAKVTSKSGRVSYSETTWSDEPGKGTPKPFLLSSAGERGEAAAREKPKETASAHKKSRYDLHEDFEGKLVGWSEYDPGSVLNPRNKFAKKNGQYGMSVTMSSPNPCTLVYDIGSDRKAVAVGFWYKTPASLKGTWWSTFLLIRDGANKTVTSVNIAGNNEKPLLRLYDGATHTNGPRVSFNTWYWVTLRTVRGGTCALRVYDATGAQVGKDAAKKGANAACRAIWFNKSASDYGEKVFECFDDFTADWTDAKFPLVLW